MTEQTPERRKHVRNRIIFAVFAVLVTALALIVTPAGAYRMEPGPVFALSEEVNLPEPHDLEDTAGEWQVLTVNAYPLKVIDELIIKTTGRSNELYRAHSGEAGTLAAAEAEAARQQALNAAMNELTGDNGLLLVHDTENTDVPEGSRLLAVNGAAPAPGAVPAGQWLVVEPDGRFQVHDVASTTAHAKDSDPREPVDHLTPLPPGVDAVSTPAFELAEVGGSSAGLISTLAWIDALTEGDLTDGRTIAGTGSVTDDGQVIEVSGVEFKLQAAADANVDLALIPTGYDGPIPEDLNVTQVDTVEQALEALAN